MRQKRFLAILLCVGIAISGIGCSKKKQTETTEKTKKTKAETTVETTVKDTEPQETSETTEATPTPTPTPEAAPIPEITPRTASAFGEFVPYVASELMKQCYTDEDLQDYYHFCEAVLAEEDSFPCHSFSGYETAYHMLSRDYFPYGYDVVACPEEEDFKDGVAKIRYNETKEWRDQRYNDLKNACEEIFQNVFKEDYTDFEKVLSLYLYFAKTYTYDQNLEHSTDGYREVYRPLMRKIGVCNEFAAAYAYLLLQVGVEADYANGFPHGETEDGHRWNLVRLDGEYYHLDTTWAIGNCRLEYFLMDDDQRTEHGTIFKDGIEITEVPRFDETNFKMTSRKYSELWDALYYEVDYDNNVIRYTAPDQNGDVIDKEFHY